MAIKAGIIETVLEIGQSCTELISTLCEAPKDANDLVAWIIRLFVSDGRPSQELRNAILDMEAREVEGAAIISWMLVTAVDHHHIESAVLKVLGAANSMDQLPSMIHSMIFWLERDLNIKSSDLFLMTIKNTSRQNAKRIGKVIDQFILMSDIFDRSVIQNSLTRAYNIRQPPVLLMRATMQIMRAYPEMLDVSLDLMDSLIQRPVWEVPQFESGFIRFVKMCQPRSLKLLKRLSISRRNRLLEEHSDLKTAYLFNERLS
ncbi:Symplekin tight junction protein C terminal-domain-containing protein [Syncephalis fuscata]|nr:Symplekin tight junction protein C terminal-domain-containing protein [Syncephalis fuscata]